MENTGKKEPAGLSAMGEQLEKYIGPYCGDVYDTARRVFPSVSMLERVGVFVASDFDQMAFGFTEDGQPRVFIGKNDTIITPRLRSRIVKRFDLPTDIIDAPQGLFLPFVLAHELGHAIQADETFPALFGSDMDMKALSPEDGYDAYIQSDKEVNADYIAAVIMSRGRLGQEAGLQPPGESFDDWRMWGKAHRITLSDL